MEGKDEVIEKHSVKLLRELYLNTNQPEVIKRDDCHTRIIDILFEVK